MQWPLPLWLTLEEELDQIQRDANRRGEPIRLLDWTFAATEIIRPGPIWIALKLKQRNLADVLTTDPFRPAPTVRRLIEAAPYEPTTAERVADALNELISFSALYLSFEVPEVPDVRWVRKVVTELRPNGDPSRVNRYLLEAAFQQEVRKIERFRLEQIRDTVGFAERLSPRSCQLRKLLRSEGIGTILDWLDPLSIAYRANSLEFKADLVDLLNRLLRVPNLYTVFSDLPLASDVKIWIDEQRGCDPTHANRLLLESAFSELYKVDDWFLTKACRLIHRYKPTALCLSGGGIRSATFALGVLQGLAHWSLLDKFDYLSTVSGGGYIGSMLTAWIQREGFASAAAGLAARATESASATAPAVSHDPPPLAKIQMRAYEKFLRRGGAHGQELDDWLDAEKELTDSFPVPHAARVEPIRHLREYSNYLSPRLGLISTDFWSLLAIYLRNLLPNWAMLLPFLGAILMVPYLFLAILELKLRPTFGVCALLTSLLSGSIAIAYQDIAQPSRRTKRKTIVRIWQREHSSAHKAERSFLFWCLTGRLLTAFSFSLWWLWRSQAGAVAWTWISPRIAFVSLLCMLVLLALAGLVYARVPRLWLFFGCLTSIFGVGLALLSASPFVSVIAFSVMLSLVPCLLDVAILESDSLPPYLPWVASALIFGLVVYGLSLIPVSDLSLYLCFAVPIFLLVWMVTSATIFVVWSGREITDEDREWLAKSTAYTLIAAALWLWFASVSLLGPRLVLKGLYWVGGISAALLGALWRGAISRTPRLPEGEETTPYWSLLSARILPAIGAVFITMFAAVLAMGMEWASGLVLQPRFQPLIEWPGVPVLVLILASAAYSIWASHRVDINTYSLHGMYRNRLIRAYLGATRNHSDRRPNLFSGFDPDDDLPMSALLQRPLHVLNVALNVVRVMHERLAWQERKAESFTVTALHSGSHLLGYRDSKEYGAKSTAPHPRLQPGGITLGTAMAISGAAANPASGYYSSPILAFWLTLFNARLGAWFGNPGPAGGVTFTHSEPERALTPLLKEALGWTSDADKYVCLSDGGHFENLGVYEMVLRRCHRIVVVDAGADPEYRFADLANSVRKIRIDLAIPIEFQREQLRSLRKWRGRSSGDRATTCYCALGLIKYKEADGSDAEDGILVYIKPTLRGDEPPDVTNYEAIHVAFPHQPTTNQFYSESQFESYRILGLHEMLHILGHARGASVDIEQFIEAAREHVR